jgi:hypothetical protein
VISQTLQNFAMTEGEKDLLKKIAIKINNHWLQYSLVAKQA